MKFVLIISCWVLASINLAEAFVSSLEDSSLEFTNSNVTNDAQLIDETISFIERTEDFETNSKSGGVTSDLCLRNYRGAIGGISNRCLNVKNGSTTNQTPLIMFNCSNNANQRFMTLSSDNTIRVLGRCLDAGIGANNGAFVRIHDCHGQVQQQWIITSSGQIVNVGGDNCLHAITTVNEAAIHVNQCDGSASQRWTFN